MFEAWNEKLCYTFKL